MRKITKLKFELKRSQRGRCNQIRPLLLRVFDAASPGRCFTAHGGSFVPPPQGDRIWGPSFSSQSTHSSPRARWGNPSIDCSDDGHLARLRKWGANQTTCDPHGRARQHKLFSPLLSRFKLSAPKQNGPAREDESRHTTKSANFLESVDAQ